MRGVKRRLRDSAQLVTLRRKLSDAAQRQTELLSGIELANGLARHNSELRAGAEAKLRHVLALLPEGSVCAPPRVERLAEMPPPYVRFQQALRQPFMALSDPASDHFQETRIEELEQIIVDAFPDRIADKLHMLLQVGDYPDCKVRYALGRKAIYELTAPQLEELLRKQIVPQMVAAVVKAMKGRFA